MAGQYYMISVQFSSVAQWCPTLCNPMNLSMPGLPVHHQCPESTQTHVHCVSYAIQPSHPLSSPSPPAVSLSQHQGLFKWVISLHQVAKILEFQLQHQAHQWTSGLISFRMNWLDFLAVQGLSRVFSNTTVQKHQFFGGQLKTIALTKWTFVGKVMSLLFTMLSSVQFRSVQLSHSVVSDSATPWIAAHQASLSITNSRSLLKPMSIELVMPSNHLILCHHLLLLPSIFPRIRVFSNESALCIRWPKYWSFSFNIRPSNEHPGLISFRMDWLDLLAVQGTPKSLLQHHSWKVSIFWCSAFFTVQLTSIHDHWKNHSLDQMELCWQSDVSAF